MDESNVRKPLLKPVMFRDIEEFTLEKNPMDVSNVAKPLIKPVTFRTIEELTQM
jgi:hypothetical protein